MGINFHTPLKNPKIIKKNLNSHPIQFLEY